LKKRLVLIFSGVLLLAHSGLQANEQIARGKYLINAGGCISCHTVEDGGDDDFLAGGRVLESPFGNFYAPNITPHPKHGIGNWSDEDFIRAFRDGVSPGGEHYYPAFPYTSFTGITDMDLLAMKAYLFSLPKIDRSNKAHDLSWTARFRSSLWGWKKLYFEPGVFDYPDGDAVLRRGAYLVRHLGHCGECHTPRGKLGGVDSSKELQGNKNGPEGNSVPGITSLAKSGIGKWADDDLSYFLETGMDPDGDFAGGSMTDVIDHNTSRLSEADRLAIVRYLRSL
jgi:mono/diheme cytochrome c family protein